MKGSHRIIVESRKVKYDFVIHRNITIITGDSGSGKTVLIDLIHDYGRYGANFFETRKRFPSSIKIMLPVVSSICLSQSSLSITLHGQSQERNTPLSAPYLP